MARRSGPSESTIGRIWRKFDLKPHLIDGFKLFTDPLFVEKVVEVVGLYHNPAEKAVVLCVDENPRPSPGRGQPRRSSTPWPSICRRFQADTLIIADRGCLI